MKQKTVRSWSRLDGAGFKAIVLACLMALIAACGGNATETTAEPATTTTGDAATTTTEASPEETTTTAAEPAELREITVAIPAPTTIPFYPLWIAESRGYLAEEGLKLADHVYLESSGQVLQAVITGDVTVGLASLGPLAGGVSEGGEMRSIYALYENEVTQIAVPAGSDIQTLADLEGKVIGAGPSDAGPTVLVRGVLASEFDWEEGVDYQFLEVGDGGQAAIAFERGDIDAYANSFLEMATMTLAGVEYTNIMPDTYDDIPNTLTVVLNELIETEPEVIEGLGRAMARATVWGMANPEEVANVMVADWEPEAAERLDFMVVLVEISNSLFEVPPAGDGQWGWHSEDAINFQIELLSGQGRLEGAEELEASQLYTNDFLGAYNDFDPADL